MKKYVCHKTVMAEPMTLAETLMAEPMTLAEAKEKFGVVRYNGTETDGYFFKYEDGYESWSPKSTFEKCYELVKEQ